MAELNVESVESFASAGDLVDYSAKGNFRALGKRFGKQTPLVAAAIASADAAVLSADLITHGRAFVLVTDLGEVEVSRRGRDHLRAATRGLVGGERAG